MYLPAHFAMDDKASILAILRDYPLATLVYQDQHEFQAEHLPCVYQPAAITANWGSLFCHAAIGNRLVELASAAGTEQGLPILAIFQGPSAYVTPSWYEDKVKTGEVVPTYNYAVVHVYGRLRLITDAQEFAAKLALLSDHFEQSREKAWRMDDAPAEFLQQIMQAIAGLDIQIERVVGKAKMSQNKTSFDRQTIADGLRAEGAAAVSEIMEQQLFAATT